MRPALYSKLITRKYEIGSYAAFVPGRASGSRVGSSQDPGADYNVSYFYDAVGRMEHVSGPGVATPGVRYEYLAGSNLVRRVGVLSGTATVVSTTLTYENDRDLIQSVENIRDADDPDTTISKYAYVNDAVGRRTSVANTGEAFAANAFTLWGYNTRSELESSKRYTGTYTPTPDSGDEVTPERRLYAYDPIGNRREATEASVTTEYTTNELNQYTHSASGISETYFIYDEDGNLVNDLAWNYFWDGENRLIRMETDSPSSSSARRLVFEYDYMSRRVRKLVYAWDNGLDDWEPEPLEDLRFVYDRWNVILVLDGLDNNAVLKKYTWGLDLSGQRGDPSVTGIHGAGGIGGLLAVQETTGTHAGSYWFLYDANGNVAQVVQNTTNYPLAAHYEYDAYGNTIVSTGAYAAANPFLFSTKWLDADTYYYYYGYRYYDTPLGRWPSRDPIEEHGGYNLHIFVNNNPIVWQDPDGKSPWITAYCYGKPYNPLYQKCCSGGDVVSQRDPCPIKYKCTYTYPCTAAGPPVLLRGGPVLGQWQCWYSCGPPATASSGCPSGCTPPCPPPPFYFTLATETFWSTGGGIPTCPAHTETRSVEITCPD